MSKRKKCPEQAQMSRRGDDGMRSIKTKVLIVEDDPGICSYLTAILSGKEYEIILAGTGEAAVRLMSSQCPDLILLDLGLPDLDGNCVIEQLRGWSRVPIIVISARAMEEDKAKALDLGADDYLVKPFGEVELKARIRTALRHRQGSAGHPLSPDGVVRIGELIIDYNRKKVFISGRDASLTPNEFRILSILGRSPGEIVTYREILREMWGPYMGTDNKILRVHMAAIRRKIEQNAGEPQFIFTEPGLGYRLAWPE